MAKPADDQPVLAANSGLSDYWQHARHPLSALVFVLPMLLVYEAGVLLRPEAMRNGADHWLRTLLETIGLGQYFLLPLLVGFLLLAWNHVCRHPWRVRWEVLAGMSAESALLGVLLVLLASGLYQWYPASTGTAGSDLAERIVAYCGAGIYEEVLFRLMLLPAAAAGLTWAGCGRRTSLVVAALAVSLVFAGAHYRLFTSVGDDFEWFSFTFRFAAGAFFSALFLLRGFGVAVGAHACYDIFAALV